MRVTCPHCLYSRNVPREKIPSGADAATCPKCGKRFLFRPMQPPPESPADTPPDSPQGIAEPPPDQPAESVTFSPEAQEEPPDPIADPRDSVHAPEEPEAEAESTSEPAQDASGQAEVIELEADKDQADQAEPSHESDTAPPESEPDESSLDPGQDESSPEMWQGLENLDFAKGPVRRAPAPPIPDRASPPGTDPVIDEEQLSSPAQPSRPVYGGYFPDPAHGRDLDPPWENLEKHGFFPGVYRTVLSVMFSPASFFRNTTLLAPAKRPKAFYLLFYICRAMIAFVWASFLSALEFEAMGLEDYTFPLPDPMALGYGLILLMLLLPVIAWLQLHITTGILHLFLRVFQAAPRGFNATLRVTSYAIAPSVVFVFPVFGPYIAFFWSLPVIVMGCRNVHRVSYARTLCALAGFLVFILAFVIGLAYFLT